MRGIVKRDDILNEPRLFSASKVGADDLLVVSIFPAVLS